MSSLSTRYLGLELDNPIIVGASGLTASVEAISACAAAGAGAVVMKSLFEEQIRQQVENETREASNVGHPEASAYMASYSRENAVEQYLEVLRRAKRAVNIPVIASVHCVTAGGWVEFANRLVAAGADAIELNLFVMPSDAHKTGADIEGIYFDVVSALLSKVKVPVSLKLGHYFSGMANTMVRLGRTEVAGLVLFNRFRAPDIDIDNVRIEDAALYTTATDYVESLRWISILANQVSCDLAAATGVHDGKTVIKQILAGAHAVQVCSTLYQNGLDVIGTMKDELRVWMDTRGMSSIDAFRGALGWKATGNPADYDRVQFMKLSLSIS